MPLVCKTAMRCPGPLQNLRGRKCLAASVLENPAVKPETGEDTAKSDDIDGEEPSRQDSHLHASSSNGSSFYEGSGSGAEDLAASDAVDGFTLEINACDDIDDILEIVGDEADVMSGSNLAAALKRIASLAKLKSSTSKKRQKRKQASVTLGRSEEFSLLLGLVQEKSYEMSPADISDCLWSLASMDMRVVRHLRHMQREVELRVGDMSERDLATVTWSFASLRHNPGALLDLIAEAASPRLPAFESRGLSMMLWAFSKFDHVPPLDFLDQIVHIFDQDFSRFSNQSVANIVYALGKLKHPLPPSICERVENLVTAETAQPFRDVETANILYGFVRTSYQAPKLIELLERRIADKRLLESSASMVWASLIWGTASLGLSIQPATLSSLQGWGLKEPDTYSPSSICNLAWGLALLGEVSHPVFSEVIAAAVRSHKQRTLEPRLMRQLFQAVSSARVLGTDVTIPEDLEQTAYKWWRKGNVSKAMSMTHEAVARAVKKLGLDSAAQHIAGYGLPMVDIAIEAKDHDIAMMIVPPEEYSSNDGQPQPLGRIQSSTRLLEAAGWKVVILPASSLQEISNDRSVLRAVGKLLEELGIETEWKEAVRAAPKSVPKFVASNVGRWAEDETEGEEIIGVRGRSRKQIPASKSDHLFTDEDTEETLAGAEDSAGETETDLLSIEALEEKRARDRVRQKHVAEAMKGDFMEDWVSLSSWKVAKKVIPGQKSADS